MKRKRQIDDALTDVLRDPAKRRAWVIYQLSLKGLSLSAVGRRVGVSRHAVYSVFKGQYPKMEETLAGVLGVTPDFLFPERFDGNGQRLTGHAAPRKPGRARKSTGERKPRKDGGER